MLMGNDGKKAEKVDVKYIYFFSHACEFWKSLGKSLLASGENLTNTLPFGRRLILQKSPPLTRILFLLENLNFLDSEKK